MAKTRKRRPPLTDFEKALLIKIGDELNKKREALGSTNYGLWAWENDLNPGFIGELQRGERDFKFLYLVNVLVVLKVSLKDFFSKFPEPIENFTSSTKAD